MIITNLHKCKRMNKLKHISFIFSLIAVAFIIFDLGFKHSTIVLNSINRIYIALVTGITIGIPVKYIFDFNKYQKIKIWIIDFIIWLFFILLLKNIHFSSFSGQNTLIWGIQPKLLLALAFSVSLTRELSILKMKWKYIRTNPAAIFVLSFAILVLAGSFLLMLPKATYNGISFTNAIFTSTSAVCVTGLAVVDTGTYFTPIGQTIIMVLIQLGGIGIMTFTSFFAYFFLGGVSYQNLILLGNLTSENKISQVLNTLKSILFFTFFVEGLGALFIYWNINNHPISAETNSAFFAIFHSVSAFCNAGFSTLSNSLYETDVRFNYTLQIIIAFLFIIGGLGFHVFINLYDYMKHLIVNRLLRLNKHRENIHKARVIKLNTKLVLITTLILLFAGTVIFLVLEKDNTLAEHHGLGKIITAFFGAATPRTAGFNSIDTSMLKLPTVLLVIFLMWIGASPASTGGGIKTSTFSLAILNAISLAKGTKKMELNKREIPEISTKRAFTTIFLSILIIGSVMFLLLITEQDKSATDLLFEVVSAFSTSGLSRGITAALSPVGKYLIILTMFAGRIGALTLLSAMVKQSKEKSYQYPSENVLIN